MPGRFDAEAQAAPQGFHITRQAHEGGQRVRYVRFCDAPYPARSWRCNLVTRGSAVGHRKTKALVSRKGERITATTTTTSRTMASTKMSSQVLSTAVGRWPLSRMKKIQGLQEAVR